MYKNWTRMCSMLLVIVMLINMLPVSAFAAGSQSRSETSTAANGATVEEEDVYVLDEIVQNRTKYSKEFRLSNGLNMATVYASAVHYENEGHWEEIDNTLKLSTARSGNVYTNTAGGWQVAFPQNLSGQTAVTITKDGYTLSFYMSGELRSTGNEGTQFSMAATEDVGQATYILETAQDATAEIQEIDTTEMFANAQFEETVMDKLVSCLRYDNVYENTDVVYKLDSTQVKESIIMEHYDEDLRGYSYILDIGEMEPVLTETNEIQLYDKSGENLVMLIPMPYLVDSAGEYCHDVEVCLEKENDYYVMSYVLPQSWLAAEERSWPVILDPIVQAEATKSNIVDQNVYSLGTANPGAGVIQCGWHSNVGISRGYLKYDQLPELSTADVIVSATIRLCKSAGSSTNKYVEVHKVTETWTEGQMQWATQADFDPTIEDYAVCKAKGYYYWDITEIARDWYATENTGMLFKMPDSVEQAAKSDFSQFWSADYDIYQSEEKPQLIIMFRNNNGLESYWDYTSSSAGRAGTGYINNYTGNLVWVRSDIGFGGNRMPVVISHIYNANDSTNNLFGMGNGWRTNFNQRVYQWSTNTNYYVWEDSDGTAHYFPNQSGTYKDEDGLELTLTVGGEYPYTITDKYGNSSHFDAQGRLIAQVNNQLTRSSIGIVYQDDTGYLIKAITDGAGRVYSFAYNTDGMLSKISYKGTGTTELSHVAFNYTDSNLISITDKDGKVSQYTYTTNSLLRTAQDIDGYLLEYTYNTLTAGLPNRIQKVVEKVVTEDGDVSGGELTITYAQNQTTFTDVNQNVQILQFNTWGNVISVQDDQGRARYARYATDDAESTEEAVTAAEEATQPTEPKGNQLTLSSKLQNTVGNVLKDSSFENGTNWTAVNGATRSIASGTAYIGSKSQKVTSTAAGSAVGVASASFSVAVGETYTFSAYIKAEASTAYLALHDGTKTVKSEVLAADLGWRRLEVSYTATSAATVTARLMTEDAGTIYMDCVQVEKAPTASRYNLVENGDFRYTTGWTPISGRTTATADAQAPALELSADIYKLDGSMSATNRISQTVNVSGAKDDTFILAGWGKGNSAPLDVFAVQDREFGLILTFNYTDNTTDTFRIHFNPYVDTWQYAASPMVAKKDYRSVTVEVAYDYNVNTAYFDGIQLYKEEFGTSYTYDGEGNIKKVTDVRGETTEYTYDDDNNVTSIELPTETKLTYTYDDYHNVLIATTETGVKYEFGYDAYGNNTSVSITSGENVITSTATYTDDFNRLLSTTDAAGKTTTYSYNADTNVLEWVQYPEDTEATRTRYTYDSMYRLASAAATTSTGSALTASYTYTNDLLTKIQTGSTTYNFTYGSFGLRTEVLVGGNSLAKYVYAHINDPEGTYDDNPISALSKLDYGNEDSVEYTYDTHGRVTQEKYEDGDTVSYKYDNNGALATVTDSATNITTTYYYDFTDRLMKYVESNGTNTHSVSYEYDDINNLTQLVETINGNSYTTSYVYDDDNRVKSVTSGGTEKSYGYDDYGRISSQSVKNDTSSIFTTSYDYLEYTVTKPDNSGTYTAETGQVTELIIDAAGYDVEYAYTYDDNGNILSVTKGTNKTNYTYDSANQLIREDNPAAGKTWVWAYDNAGNIDFRKEYAYTTGTLGTVVDTINYEYGDINRPGWGDLLTTYDGLTIDYDDIGNPLFVKDSENNVVRSYTWEHGRQLAAMNNGASTWYFTYDVNGMRTKRTNNTTTYEYVYNGSQLSQMAITNFLGFDFDFSFFYDANGTPMSFTFNDTMYYYVTNLQGDVVNIINAAGQNLGEYHYDAWGKVVDITQGDSGETDDVFILITNPLFYRGYVFDQESGLYYLQSRYYDPEIGRFINADSLVSTGQGLLGNNMFAYCLNSPAVRRDVTGTAGISYTTGDESPWSDLAPRNLGSGGGAGGSGDIIGGRFGGGHGNPTHKKRIENHMDELQASGQYSQIYGNRALSTAGQVGNQRPDVIGIKQDGTVEVWEFASPSQATGTAGYYALQVKIDIMQAANPSAIFHEIIPW